MSILTKAKLNLSCIAALALTSGIAQAQSLQSGPEFTLGGYKLFQVNKGDSNFDPSLLQREFAFGYDEPTREGIVEAWLTVNADGTVADVKLIGGFYDEKFLDTALNSLKGSTFTPATAGGVAVDWPGMYFRVIERGAFLPGISESFKPEYEKLLRLIADKNMAEAETLAKKLLAGNVSYLFEYALLESRLADIYVATERLPEALIASRNATGTSKAVLPSIRPDTRIEASESAYTDEFLTPDLYAEALRQRFFIALGSNQTGEALQVHALLEERAKLSGNPALLDGVTAKVAELTAALNSEQSVGSVVKLIDGRWEFVTSTRKIFGVTGLQGQVDYIDMVCDNSVKKRMAFQNDLEWKIPDAWQNCALEFIGTEGSQFNLYEFLN